MDELTQAELNALMRAIALKEGNAREISQRFGVPVPQLKAFVASNRDELATIREAYDRNVSIEDLDKLWITQKTERLQRYQAVADKLYTEIMQGSRDSTDLREFRSYLAACANELGQLLHRGAGEAGSDTLNVDIVGVDLENLK